MDEKHLLRKLQSGDSQALEYIIRQYGAYVMTVARNRSRKMLAEEDLEEISSDVFVALWEHAKTIQCGHLKQWLGSVTRNKTIDRLRRQNLCAPLEDTTLFIDDSLWEHLVQKERESLVTSALQSLDKRDQELFFRYYDLCQTAQEISDQTGINASTVRTRLSRGREKLKQILCKGGFVHENEP